MEIHGSTIEIGGIVDKVNPKWRLKETYSLMDPSDLDFITLWLNGDMRVIERVIFAVVSVCIECRLWNSAIGIEWSCAMCKREGFDHWVMGVNFEALSKVIRCFYN